MKKWMLILVLLLSGCSKNEKNIVTVVENTNNIVIAINYPETGVNKFDKMIEDYVNEIYQSFKEEYESLYSLSESSELNIDYKYDVISDRYINVSLYTFISSSNLAHPINEMITFVYDKQKQKIVTLEDLIDQKQLTELVPLIKTKLISKYKDCILIDLLESKIIPNYDNFNLFTFDNNNLTLYFNPYYITSGNCGIININIPIDNLDFKVKIKDTVKSVEKIIETNNDKILYPDKKAIAITFDDGPSKYTRKILELLKEYDSNATFFVLGNKVDIYKDTLMNSISMGNEIGNHTYNHKWLTKLTDEEFEFQITGTNEALKNIGYDCKLFRPAYGSLNKKIREKVNMPIVMWSVDSSDWKIKNSKKIADRVLKDVDDLDIVLFHDTYERTYSALKIIIPKLVAEGYQLVTVSELEEIKLLRNAH